MRAEATRSFLPTTSSTRDGIGSSIADCLFAAILQYNATLANSGLTVLQTTKNFNVDFLFTYIVNPWTALYVGVNSNYQNLRLEEVGGTREIVRTRHSLLNNSRQVFVKYSYLLRF